MISDGVQHAFQNFGLTACFTFILKNVILVSRSIVDLRSCSLLGSDAGKYFYNQQTRCTKQSCTA